MEPSKNAPTGYSRFVRHALSLVPAAKRVDALRCTSAQWVGQLRRLLARPSQGWFYDLEQLQDQRNRVQRESGAWKPTQLTHWRHPSLTGLPTLDRHPDSSTEAKRRRAEALVLSAVRLCDCQEPLDTMVFDVSLLAHLEVFWDAMLVLSAGRFAREACHTTETWTAAPNAPWFKGRSFFCVGSFVAARLDQQVSRFMLEHVARVPMTPMPPMKRATTAWWASLPPSRRLQLLLLWVGELKALLAQRRRLLSLAALRAPARATGRADTIAAAPAHADATSDVALLDEVILLEQLAEALLGAPHETHGPRRTNAGAVNHGSWLPLDRCLSAGIALDGELLKELPPLLWLGMRGVRPTGASGDACVGYDGCDALRGEAFGHSAAAIFLRVIYERPISRVGSTFDLSCRKMGAVLVDEEARDRGDELVADEEIEQRKLRYAIQPSSVRAGAVAPAVALDAPAAPSCEADDEEEASADSAATEDPADWAKRYVAATGQRTGLLAMAEPAAAVPASMPAQAEQNGAFALPNVCAPRRGRGATAGRTKLRAAERGARGRGGGSGAITLATASTHAKDTAAGGEGAMANAPPPAEAVLEPAPLPEVSAWVKGPPLACQQPTPGDIIGSAPATEAAANEVPKSATPCGATAHPARPSSTPPLGRPPRDSPTEERPPRMAACCASASDAIWNVPQSALPSPWGMSAYAPCVASIDPLPIEPMGARSPQCRTLDEFEWSSCGGLALVEAVEEEEEATSMHPPQLALPRGVYAWGIHEQQQQLTELNPHAPAWEPSPQMSGAPAESACAELGGCSDDHASEASNDTCSFISCNSSPRSGPVAACVGGSRVGCVCAALPPSMASGDVVGDEGSEALAEGDASGRMSDGSTSTPSSSPRGVVTPSSPSEGAPRPSSASAPRRNSMPLLTRSPKRQPTDSSSCSRSGSSGNMTPTLMRRARDSRDLAVASTAVKLFDALNIVAESAEVVDLVAKGGESRKLRESSTAGATTGTEVARPEMNAEAPEAEAGAEAEAEVVEAVEAVADAEVAEAVEVAEASVAEAEAVAGVCESDQEAGHVAAETVMSVDAAQTLEAAEVAAPAEVAKPAEVAEVADAKLPASASPEPVSQAPSIAAVAAVAASSPHVAATASPGSPASASSSPAAAASPAGRSDKRLLEVVQAENVVLREACRRFENDLLALSSLSGPPGHHKLPSCLGGPAQTQTPSGLSTPSDYPGRAFSESLRHGATTPPAGGFHGLGSKGCLNSKALNAALSAAQGQPSRQPYWVGTPGSAGNVAASTHFDASAQLAAASARLSSCAAHLASLAAKAALAPVHTTYAMLSEDIRLYEARCTHHLALHAPVHNAAINKVRSVAAQLWPRAQVKTFGSFATGLMRPGSDIDLIVTLPPVRTATAMPQAPGTLEGRNALPEETWQASLARCLKDQAWVFPETVRQIDALVPIVSFATRFFVSAGSANDGSTQAGTPLRLDVSFEGGQHNGLATNIFVQRTLAERPDVKPLTLVLKQFLAERSLDKPYLGGLSSYGLLLLVLRFLQSRDEHPSAQDEAENNLGARLVKLLDYYGRVFDTRNNGISVARNMGAGEFIMRDHSQRVRVDLSQLHVHSQTGWPGMPPQQEFRYGAASGARSEAGDWCPSIEQPLSPTQRGVQRGALVKGFDWPMHRPVRAASTLPTHRWRQHSLDGAVELPDSEGVDSLAKFWFDPLYVEDPLRPSNNVGRNCFRIYAIQQEFCKAHTLCTMHPGEYPPDCEYPILSRLCKALP